MYLVFCIAYHIRNKSNQSMSIKMRITRFSITSVLFRKTKLSHSCHYTYWIKLEGVARGCPVSSPGTCPPGCTPRGSLAARTPLQNSWCQWHSTCSTWCHTLMSRCNNVTVWPVTQLVCKQWASRVAITGVRPPDSSADLTHGHDDNLSLLVLTLLSPISTLTPLYAALHLSPLTMGTLA